MSEWVLITKIKNDKINPCIRNIKLWPQIEVDKTSTHYEFYTKRGHSNIEIDLMAQLILGVNAIPREGKDENCRRTIDF